MEKVSRALKQAQLLFNKCQYQEALELYLKLVKFLPGDKQVNVYEQIVLCCRRQGNYTDALSYQKQLDELLKSDSEYDGKELRDDLANRARVMDKAWMVTVGFKKPKKSDRELISKIKAGINACQKAVNLRHKAEALAKRAAKYKSTDSNKARKLFFKAADRFKAAAFQLMPEEHKDREIQTFWAVFPASTEFNWHFDQYIRMLKLTRAWEQLGSVYEAKDRELAGDYYIQAAENRKHLVGVRKQLKHPDIDIWNYKSLMYENAEELYKYAIGVERKKEAGDELEQKYRDAIEKKEGCKRKFQRLLKESAKQGRQSKKGSNKTKK